MIPPYVQIGIKVKHGNYYIAKVDEVLKHRGVLNAKGKPHGDTMISKVFNNDRRNAAIEDAIKTAFKDVFEEYEKSIGTKKPEAVTPG